MLELSLRAAVGIHDRLFKPAVFHGELTPEQVGALSDFITKKCGSGVDAMFNTWVFSGWPDDQFYMMKRATWDSPMCFREFGDMLLELRVYYKETGR